EAPDSWHIVSHNLSTGETTCLTAAGTLCENPALCGTVVVWEEAQQKGRNIRGYDFSTGRYIQITDSEDYEINPAIGEGIVVWEAHGKSNGDIQGMNLETHHQFRIADEGLSNDTLSAWNTIVVWENLGRVYWIDLKTGRKTRIESLSVKHCPTLYGSTIVWEDYRNKNADIYGYDLGELEEFPISVNALSQKHPDVFGNIVVWEDERNENLDIYCCSLPIQIISTTYVLLMGGLMVLLVIVLIRKEE
ncbi:MAG: hypothetical protein HXS45_07955, partial [Theionarchaea archaeon]|nr:hypothetical protein [Theionarchaea archaeon]